MKRRILIIPLLAFLTFGCTAIKEPSSITSNVTSSSSEEVNLFEQRKLDIENYFNQDAISFILDGEESNKYSFDEFATTGRISSEVLLKKEGNVPNAYVKNTLVNDISAEEEPSITEYYYQNGFSFEDLDFYKDVSFMSFDTFKLRTNSIWAMVDDFLDNATALKSDNLAFEIDVEGFQQVFVERLARFMAGHDFSPQYLIEANINRLIAVQALGEIEVTKVELGTKYQDSKLIGLVFKVDYTTSYGEQSLDFSAEYDLDFNDATDLVVPEPTFGFEEFDLLGEVFSPLSGLSFEYVTPEDVKYSFHLYMNMQYTTEPYYEEIQQYVGDEENQVYIIAKYDERLSTKVYSNLDQESAGTFYESITQIFSDLNDYFSNLEDLEYDIEFDGSDMTIVATKSGEVTVEVSLTYHGSYIIIDTFNWLMDGESKEHKITTITPTPISVPTSIPLVVEE